MAESNSRILVLTCRAGEARFPRALWRRCALAPPTSEKERYDAIYALSRMLAVGWLAKYALSSQQVRQKLSRYHTVEKVHAQVIDYCCAKGWLDDHQCTLQLLQRAQREGRGYYWCIAQAQRRGLALRTNWWDEEAESLKIACAKMGVRCSLKRLRARGFRWEVLQRVCDQFPEVL